jgi:hypothetical protein
MLEVGKRAILISNFQSPTSTLQSPTSSPQRALFYHQVEGLANENAVNSKTIERCIMGNDQWTNDKLGGIAG